MHKVLQILLMPLQGAQTYSNLTQTYSMMLKPICSMLGGLFTDCWVALLSEVIMLTSDDHFCGIDAVLSAHRSMSRQQLCMHVVGYISPPFEFWLGAGLSQV